MNYRLRTSGFFQSFLCLFDVSDMRGTQRSVNPVSSASQINGLESGTCALIENIFGLEALVLIVVVGTHARSEGGKIGWAELLQDVLARGAIVFSGEARERDQRKMIAY